MEAIGVITPLGWFLVGVGLMLPRLPAGTCSECEHCRMVVRRHELEQEQSTQDDIRRLCGVSRCARCGEHHRIGGPC